MLGVNYEDRKTNEWIRSQTKVRGIVKTITERKWTWAGHISRMTDKRWTKSITEWRPMVGERTKSRPMKRVEG